MKVTPYLHFNGNCADAIALYERAFGIKARIFRYRDTPTSEGYTPPEGTEDWVMHANIGDIIYLCDTPQKMTNGDAISVCVTLDSVAKVKDAYAALLEGGESGMEPQQTFFAKCFSSLKDSFGVTWMVQCE